MNSVKTKLFISFVVIIFAILIFLTIVTIYFFNMNYQTNTKELIKNTFPKIEKYISNHNELDRLDENIDLQNQFLLILKDDEVIFTNKSKYYTKKILKELDFDEEDFAKEYLEMLEEQSKYGMIYDDEYIFKIHELKKNKQIIKIFLGVNQKYLDNSLGFVYVGVILLNLFIFIILSILGYFLINRTIKPLKLILKELESVQKDEILSKRLKSVNTKDEFEKLVNSFNNMLEKIENSVEGIKQFSSDASHELRTPLTVIQGELDLLKAKKSTKEELEQALKTIDTEQKKLQEIIKIFLLLSRLEKENSKNKKSYLDKLIFEALEQNLATIEEKNLELQLDIDDELEVIFDEKYLQIVINNLLTNAIKYTHKGYISIEAKKQKNQTIFTLKDSGVGIEEKDLDKIFQRFYRVDKARSNMKEGLGLGLAIVKKICDKFSCDIEVRSKLNKGSSFILYF